MAFQNMQNDDEEQPQQKRLDARPKNNLYMPGTGPRTGRAAVRVGTINRDGSTSPVSGMGSATGPLSQPLPRYTSKQLDQMKEANSASFGTRPGRIDARPRNNIYAPGTGPGTGRTAIRVGTINRDGSTSPVSGMGSATGPLSQPLPRYTSEQLDQLKDTNRGGFGARPGRIDARPRNNIYAPGTGPGTGRTAIRVGTINRDGSTSPVSGMGSATGPLSQPQSKLMTPRPTPADAYKQRQDNVANAKSNGTFDTTREKFNAANPGHSMDEQGAISKKPGEASTGAGGTPSPDAGAAASMHDAMAPPAGQDRYGRTANSPSAQGSHPLPPGAGAPISSSAAGYWQAGSPNTRAISSNYGTGSSKITPPAAPPASPPDNGPAATPSDTAPADKASDAASATPAEDSGAEEDDTLEAKAKGGPVKAGKPYLVGEKGPEIIVPKQSGTVVPNHAITAAALMEMKRAGKKVVLPKGVAGAKFFEDRSAPQQYHKTMRRGRCA
ncbi:MAG: hypothetical protein K9N47_19905 [Prosthecobacter sp.]|uniref:hypothetical protein n=1 Tax=Prosthecobacter sp. TaxID=1965333 RepID=UPI002600E3D2|nr:hypothetical protein [Prosthecobacter sp.]MCF7788395.1 hypothetical protein [Prosthecobacter sp.]